MPLVKDARLSVLGNQACGLAVGGAALEPFACGDLPSMKRLHPLLPDARIRNGWSFSSMHSPMVRFSRDASGSSCHHLHSLQSPH